MLPDTKVWVGYYEDSGEPITFYHKLVMDMKVITVEIDRPRTVTVRLINWDMCVIEKTIKLIDGLNTYTIREWAIDPVIAEMEKLPEIQEAIREYKDGKKIH